MVVNRFNVYFIELDPTIGSEIKKTRPCIRHPSFLGLHFLQLPLRRYHHLKRWYLCELTAT
ncbi:MAG: hypothetical protein RLZZ419_1348 [Pseudomonadota bacterium]|jgi:hypothetical protein